MPRAVPPSARIQQLDDASLRRLAAWWAAASERTDNPRSPYHRWAVQAALEIYMREQRKDKTQ